MKFSLYSAIVLVLLILPKQVYSGFDCEVVVLPNNITGTLNKSVLGTNLKAFYVKDFNGVYGNQGAGVWNPDNHMPSPNFVALAKEAGILSLRWPGGNQARYVEWEEMIGPLDKRPNQLFGLPEFLEYCETIGAEPVITLPARGDQVQSVANLVEYLNESQDGGRNKWARQRYEDGRPEPWGVKWYELGNETYHTDMPVEEYIQLYKDYQKAMKAVDPSVMLGAVIEETSSLADGWGKSILESIGNLIDFVAVHFYLPDVVNTAAVKVPSEQIALAALASGANLEASLQMYVDAMKAHDDEGQLRMAVTEFNGGYTLDKPHPYRHTLFNAIHIAEMLRIFFKPEYKVLFSNNWLFANEHWGMVYGGIKPGDKIRKQPIYYVYKLYKNYTGDLLIKTNIKSDEIAYNGEFGIMPRLKIKQGDAPRANHSEQSGKWKLRWFSDANQYEKNGVLYVTFDKEKDVNYYHAYQEFNVEPDTGYTVTAKIRTEDLQGGKIGIGVGDARGWNKTFYQEAKIYLAGTTDWKSATVKFHTSADTRKIRVYARRIGGGGIVSGRVQFGKVSVREGTYKAGPMPAVTGLVSSDFSKKHLYMILINKDIHNEKQVEIKIPGEVEYTFIRGSVVTGDSYLANNIAKGEIEQVKYTETNVSHVGGQIYSIKIPPVSAVGLEYLKK